MSVEGRGWATRVGIDLANWRQEEPTGFDGRRQLSRGGTSRDESRGSSHGSVSGSGCNSPGRLGGGSEKLAAAIEAARAAGFLSGLWDNYRNFDLNTATGCRHQVSLTAGAVLHNTKTPLTVWC